MRATQAHSSGPSRFFVNFHCYPMGSQIVVLGNDSEEDVLDIATYHLELHEENVLLFHHALYAPAV